MLNFYWYALRRNSWMVDPSWWFGRPSDTPIDRPVFLLGNQGGGLTLVSRMLRRIPGVVSATGNNRYWSGGDELQNVMGPVLPAELTGLKYKAPPHPVMTPPRSWSYATDDLIGAYRKTALHATPEIESRFKRVIRYLLKRFGDGKGRFVDKSQVNTVRVSLISELLKDCDPRFVFICRNPFVECPRAAGGKAADMKRYQRFMNWEDRLQLCGQHWANSVRCVLEDMEQPGIKVFVIQFEKILRDPEKGLKAICDFAELSFDEDILPKPYHVIPFGSLYRDRWYPIRRHVNEPYLRSLGKAEIETVAARCGDLARTLGYEIPA